MSQLIYALISSGFNVSNDIDLTKRVMRSIAVPTLLSSGTLAVQGNHDQTSANFMRMIETRGSGSGDLQFATGLGSRQVMWPSAMESPAWARLEVITVAGSFQTDNRTFVISTRQR